MHYWRKFLDRSAFLLATVVLGGLILGWFLPATRDAVLACALAQIAMAIVVLINESTKPSSRKTP
jgi:hypothetical protein